MKKFIAMENLEVPTVVDKFMEYIWKEEGYPRTIVSDRGRQFTSHFWSRLCARTERRVKSLDYKNMGPYQITRVIDNMAYELDLPPQPKTVFPAFHHWLLQAYEDDALPGQPRPGDAAPPEVHLTDDGITEYVVSQVLDSRIRRNLVDPHTGERGLLQYKVEWVGDD
ncbi:hypothetical protein P3342_004690 [Pyrenophora teres f. teres]|nr:hypothetical protein P3342_004690 [Pyrenophora teres f. teres]